MTPMSSRAWWVIPAAPYSNPPPMPTIRTGRSCHTAPLRKNSNPRSDAKVAIE